MFCKDRNILKVKTRTKKRFALYISIFLLMNLAFFNAIAKPGDSLGVRTIIIDPGHGGKDPGCLGKYSHEADVALAVSLKLGDMLKEKYGNSINIIYTRTTDVSVDLAERAKIANRYKGDLFICIHANSGNPTAKGTEVYALGLHRTESQLRVAERENSSILMEDNHKTKYQDFNPNDPDSYIMITQLANSYLENSINFAGKIQKYFLENNELIDRGVKQAGFLVLHQVNMPSVLVETAFLTNPDEEKMLNNKDSQEKIAKAIFNAFVDYKNELENINGIITGNPVKETDDKNKNEKINTENKENGINKEKFASNEVKKDSTNLVKNNNPILEKKDNVNKDDKIWFMVQIAASSKEIECKPANFKGLENIAEHKSNDIYRYTYGKSNTFEEAKKSLAIAREKGYNDAFIVAYHNGERINVNRAIELAKQ